MDWLAEYCSISAICLILADGWYEWRRPEDPRQPKRPVHFALAHGDLPDGKVAPSCTIVACAATELVRPIHDVCRSSSPARSPGRPGDASLDGPAARELLFPLLSAELAVRPENPIVNSALHEGPDCLAQPAAA